MPILGRYHRKRRDRKRTVERDEIHDFVLIRRAKRIPFVHPARNSCSERNSGGLRPPWIAINEKGTRSGSLSLQSRSADYARRPSSGPSRLACTHACRRGGPSYPSGIRAWPLPYRVYQEALQPATGRNSHPGHNFLGHNIHGDMHASHICGGRQQRSRVLAVARYGLAPCPRTKTYLCLGIDEAI